MDIVIITFELVEEVEGCDFFITPATDNNRRAFHF